MQIDVDFPGGARVAAHFGQFTVHTDQPTDDGGDGSLHLRLSYFWQPLLPAPVTMCNVSVGSEAFPRRPFIWSNGKKSFQILAI